MTSPPERPLQGGHRVERHLVLEHEVRRRQVVGGGQVAVGEDEQRRPGGQPRQVLHPASQPFAGSGRRRRIDGDHRPLAEAGGARSGRVRPSASSSMSPRRRDGPTIAPKRQWHNHPAPRARSGAGARAPTSGRDGSGGHGVALRRQYAGSRVLEGGGTGHAHHGRRAPRPTGLTLQILRRTFARRYDQSGVHAGRRAGQTSPVP